MYFERLPLNTVDWRRLDAFADRTLYQTRAWLNFIAATQPVEPVVAALREGTETLGYFTGGIVRKFGLRMLGSPFPGWSTSYLGFNLGADAARAAVLPALCDFAFRHLHCLHLELMDRRLSTAEAQEAGFTVAYLKGYEVDLSHAEEAIFAAFKRDARGRIRKADKCGVVIEEAHDVGFAADYYAQLKDVFAKRRLIPTYNQARIEALIEHLAPTGNLLLLRARDRDGRCLATGIFPAFNDTAYYWGGASWRVHQALSPNEAIQWYAMRYWKARGMTRYDMCGGGDYKAKYGGREIAVPWVRRSKYEFLARQRDTVKKLFWLTRKLAGRNKR